MIRLRFNIARQPEKKIEEVLSVADLYELGVWMSMKRADRGSS